jgi:hypothetical protein
MSPIFQSTTTAILAATLGLLVATEASGRKKPSRDTAVGTYPEEYRGNTRAQSAPPGPMLANGDAKPEPRTSTGRELTGPGAHHGEYTVRPGDKPPVAVDTVRDRRLWINEAGDTIRDTLPRPRSSTPRRSSEPAKVQSNKPPQPNPTPGVDDKSSTRPGE